MKKVFNLSIILAVLTATFSFTSCGNDDDAASIKIEFLGGPAYAVGAPVVAKITCVEKITSIDLFKGDAKQKSIEVPKESKDGDNFVYLVNIVSEAEVGNYSIQVKSKTGDNKGSFTVTDGEGDKVYQYIELGNNTGDVVVGKTYAYEQGSIEGEFTITEASDGKVVFTLENNKTITLSDAGTSYLTTSLNAIGQTDAVANPGSVLLILKSGSKVIASGKQATNQTIKDGAKETIFYEVKEVK
jgi:hypothetical protein